jgi:hypothetical protein
MWRRNAITIPVLQWRVRGLDIVDEFYTDEPKPEQYQQKHVLDIQKGLQQSVRVVN